MLNDPIIMEGLKNLSKISEDRYKRLVDEGMLTPLTDEKSKPQEVIIKPEILDLSNVEESKETKQGFRPSTLDECIGQEKAKARIKMYIKGCKDFNENLPHLFLSAPAGCGKTIFSYSIGNEIGKKVVGCTGGELKTEQQFVDKMVECDGNILFLDEAHKLNERVGTFILPILEEGKIHGKPIKPFICIFATTHKGDLSENLSALVQRFLPIQLEEYTNKQIVQILKQFKNKTYKNVAVEDDVYNEIVKNCKHTPRIAIRLLKEYIYSKDLQLIKFNNNIIKDGITSQDIKVLKYLNENGGSGKNNIAKYLSVEPKTYEHDIEPYLIKKQFISVGSRRNITAKGREFLNELR